MVKKQQQVPTGVKIISVLNYICAAGLGILGILFIVAAGMMGSIASEIPLIGALSSGLFIVLGIISLGFGVLAFFVGRGLWKLQPWARIVAIIFICLGIIESLISMVIQGDISSNIIGLIINVIIGSYLLFNKKVKEAFA